MEAALGVCSTGEQPWAESPLVWSQEGSSEYFCGKAVLPACAKMVAVGTELGRLSRL